MESFKHYMPLLQDPHTQSKILTSISYIGVGLLVTLFLSRRLGASKAGKGAIREIGGFPIFTAWEFFARRHDFIWSNFRNDPHFKFKVLQHTVVSLRGEQSRKVYFDGKGLDFTEGYKLLMGGKPLVKDINVEEIQKRDSAASAKLVAKLLNRNRLSDVIPSLVLDLNKRLESLGNHGKMDVFKTIYDIVFQMTIRMASCTELSNNLKAVEEIRALYWTLEKSATPTSLLLPWFPSPARKKGNEATKALFMKLLYYVELRRKAPVPSSDAIDVLLEQGMATVDIVQFILGIVFAGVVNTGLISCWALVYLSFHTDWKAKAKAEVDAMVRKYTSTSFNEPISKRLATVPIAAWEDELPVLDLVIRETIRLSLTGSAFRRSLMEEATFDGGIVKRGDFLTYSFADAHLNPDIYTEPHTFDPARFTEGREEDKKGAYAFLGWGAGRHPCTGVKVAKLEVKIILASVLAAFDFKMVDNYGKPLKEIPKRDLNDIHQGRPLGDPGVLQFDRTVE